MKTENKMGTMPVKQLVISMSVPMMISMLVQALYNVVDSVFVARVSENALTAVTLAFPIQSLVIAIGSGTGVGVNAVLSRALGAKKQKDADAAAGAGILLSLIHYLIILMVGLFLSKAFISSQTSDPEIIQFGTTYLEIVTIVSIGAFMQIMMERLLQATGRTTLSMISQLTGAVINLIFDPLLIFGLAGFPKLGIAGAAWATVLGQCVAAVLGLILNLKKNKEINFSFRTILHPVGSMIAKIYQIAIPSILMISIGSIMTYLLDRILMVFSATAVAVFGAYFKLQSFFFMPVFGMNNGVVPIIAYNYGAQKKDRIYGTLRFCIKLAAAIMCCGTLVFELLPGTLLDMFSASANMKELGIPALRIIAIHFPLAAVGITLGGIFQGFGKSMYSMFVSIGRQLVVLIPVAWLLAQTGDLNAVWWCFLISEVVSLLMSVLFYRRVKREIIENI
ncbi:MAG: MATE family efflux transporter [Eubacteriales bacterium]|nr:MATE family efflux transporter [Eubacteriales bacterium]